MQIKPDRIAINPLQWMASPDGWLDPTLAPPLEQQLGVIREAGFGAVQSEVPQDMTAQEYAKLLADNGVRPGPGYISTLLTSDDSTRKQAKEQATRVAGQLAELGVSTVFLAMGMAKDAARVAHPAVGFDSRPDRLEQVRDQLAEFAAIIGAEGITPAFHPHVGTWAETEAETRFVLDTVDAGLLGFGPDMGHLGWAGADVVRLIHDYADRLAGVHVKDFDAELAKQAKKSGWDYRKTVLAGLWAEPGHGTADTDGFVDALPEGFDGWLLIEVDRGAQATPEDSVRLCGEWAATYR